MHPVIDSSKRMKQLKRVAFHVANSIQIAIKKQSNKLAKGEVRELEKGSLRKCRNL